MIDRPLIAVTAGEPAGIGPDLCLMLARKKWPARIVLLADRMLLQERAARLSWPIELADYPSPRTEFVEVWHHPLTQNVQAGRVNPINSKAALASLDSAIEACQRGEFAAMVTAPLHKAALLEAGVPFTGHTEYLADKTHTQKVVMLLVGHTAHGPLRVALATTHLPLKEVAQALSQDSLRATLKVLHEELRSKFALSDPHIAVCGLNPHAGEGGYIGREEIDIIVPVISELTKQGYRLSGPLPADTVFVPSKLKSYNCVLAMYHDQGLPVLKHASFGQGVNITLGLPFVRTSVDHGTALDLAGSGKADPASLFAAVDLAIELVRRGRQ